MAKVSEDARRRYFEKIKKYRAAVTALLNREKNTLGLIRKNPAEAALNRLSLVNEMLDIASNYITINGVSQSILRTKNEDALNNGRKTLYKGLIYLEDVVSKLVDVPFSEYEEKLAEIESISPARRYLLIKKMGLAIQLLENAYGYNTKWKWAFVEMEGRFAVCAKNIIDLRNAVINTDPRSPHYEPSVYHLRLVKRLLNQAADRYREKYELSTNRLDDFKQATALLSALRRLHTLLGERDDAENVKKKMDIWSAKLETDLRKQNEIFPKKTV